MYTFVILFFQQSTDSGSDQDDVHLHKNITNRNNNNITTEQTKKSKPQGQSKPIEHKHFHSIYHNF